MLKALIQERNKIEEELNFYREEELREMNNGDTTENYINPNRNINYLQKLKIENNKLIMENKQLKIDLQQSA